MSDEQKAAFIIAQAACANAEIAAMQARNFADLCIPNNPNPPFYKHDDFMAVQEKYLIGHNAVISFFS
jgi:hypothetical protein